MIRFLALALLCLSSSIAHARTQGQLLNVDGRKVFVNYVEADRGEPTIVLLNGLTYSTPDWDAYVKELQRRAPGLGILRFDMIGMGKTLLAGHTPVDYAIPFEDQVELTAKLMKQLGLRKSFIAGLSYGGGIAVAFGVRHPELTEALILMAPFTEPLQQMDQFIRNEVSLNRLTVPFNPASDEELYDYFLRQFIYSSYPSLEPSVLDNPYILEGVLRMVQGIRKYDTLKEAHRSLAVPTHLIVASEDQYIPKDVHDRFWKAVPKAARASRLDVSYSQHKIPETIPAYAAAWTAEIVSKRAELSRGLNFQGSTSDFTAVSGSLKIELK